MRMILQEKLRSGHVRRWHIVAVVREQTVADHMYRVGVIAEEILRALGMFSWDNNLTLNVMRLAAIHDRHEYILGDVPTPGKAWIDSMDNHNVSHGSVEDAARMIDPEYDELMQCCSPGGDCSLAGYIVKYADLLEALNYLGIFGVGSHAEQVWTQLQMHCGESATQVMMLTGVNGEQASDVWRLMTTLREGKQWGWV